MIFAMKHGVVCNSFWDWLVECTCGFENVWGNTETYGLTVVFIRFTYGNGRAWWAGSPSQQYGVCVTAPLASNYQLWDTSGPHKPTNRILLSWLSLWPL